MRLKNEIFAHVLDWLIQEQKVEDQKDLAFKIGISQNTVSRIMTGKVEPSDDTLRKLNVTFGNIFNMQYLRGESTVMLIEDVAYYKSHQKESEYLEMRANPQPSYKNDLIASLKKQVKDKDDQLADKDRIIKLLEQKIEVLEAMQHIDSSDPLKGYPFTPGVADKGDQDSTRV